ncbi:MAG: FMN-binding protein [Clostridia bacterium]|nr:FMN-binding protein [Clostridia bacterium]
MNKSLKSVITLSVICLILAVLLAGVNALTAPEIEKNEQAAAAAALLKVYPSGTGVPEKIDLAEYPDLPKTVTEVNKFSDGGYVVKLTTAGHKAGLVIMCGIAPDGKVVGAVCLASNETYGKEKTYGETTVGKNIDDIDTVDTISGATKTTLAYRNAVKDALGAVKILGGGSFDNRTEEEIALDGALPEANGEFEAMFFAVELEGVTNVFKAKNNSGYVFVTPDGYIGTDADGNAKSNLSSQYAPKLKNYLSDIKSVKTEALSVSGLSPLISSVEKTDKGTYIFTVLAEGYGINGKKFPSGEHVVIKLALSGEGRVISCMTVSEAETDGIGDVCATHGFYTKYNGKDINTLGTVDAVSGATVTSQGYTEAVRLALTSLTAVKEATGSEG